ncbi:PGF-pre-PGF domain-containing protein [Methanococcoides methylutens]|uniref:PGF-pre-PGF domain-containing protein n=1 Tax=Methanococcoides methylutens TaxID=2226 RepID=UPI004044E570
MQNKTIWLFTILLVIAILFSALAVADETLPPGNVTDLAGTPGETWIDWSWGNPSGPNDSDFSHVEVYLDGNPETTTSSTSYTTTGLTTDTVYTLSTRTVDTYGNVNSNWVNLSVRTIPDTTSPVISSVSLSTTTPDTGDPVVVTVHVTDNVGVTGVNAAGTALAHQGGDTWSGSITAVVGSHTVNVIATDAAGNTDSDNSASYTATTPDTTSPVISSVSLSTTTPDTGDPVVVTVHVTDNVGVTGVNAAGTALAHQGGDTWSGSITAVVGSHTVNVIATDAAGNTDSDNSASYTATTPDTTSPVISSVSLSTTTPDTGDPVVVTVHVTDNVGVTGVNAAGTALAHQGGDTWSGSITAVVGSHTVNVIATDAAGNTDSDNSASYTATTPDTTSPVISSVSLSTTTPDTGDPVVVTVHVTDNVGVTGVNAAGTALAHQGGDTWSGSITAVVGSHTVNVIATDAAGNTDSDNSASYTATTPDTTSPVISSVSLSTTTPDTGDPVVVTVHVTDNVGVTGVNAAGTALAHQGGDTWSGSITAVVGSHTVNVIATDAAGNTDSDNSASYTATNPDLTPPSSVTGLSESSVTHRSIAWSWTNPSDSDFSHTMIYLDGVFMTNVSSPGNSYSASHLSESTTYQISIRTVDTNGNINTNFVSDTATTLDRSAPSSVTGLSESSVTASSIVWSWTNPSDNDFSHTMVYLDNVFMTNVSTPGNSYTATGLSESTAYQISTRTVDTNGNVNTNLVSDSATTLDVTPPSSVTDLSESSVTASSITWSWANPSDGDFSHTMIYLDDLFLTSVSAPGNSYTATGLSESTTYQISTRTVDTNGNVNTDLVSDSATTLDFTPPSSISGLRDSSVTGSSITWSWTNPSDSDFSHTRIYLDGFFLTSVSAPGNSYTATGLSEFTTYQISTRTVDTSGNTNTNWVNDSATTSTSKTQPSRSVSSGGGSSSTTAEAFENIDVKDVAVMYVIKDLEKSFIFNNEGIDITYINISTDLTVGDVKAIVESLKSTSSMVSTPAEGRIYKNINIWVGDTTLKNRLTTSDVGFRVNRAWLEDNGVSEYSVKLSIYRNGDWYVLTTEKIDEDDEYVYYEAATSGDLYSHFAIVEHIESEPVSLDTGEEAVVEGINVPEPIKEDSVDESVLALEGDEGIAANESEGATGWGLNILFFAIPMLMVLVVLYTSYLKGRGGVVGLPDDMDVAESDVSETASDSTNGQEK